MTTHVSLRIYTPPTPHAKDGTVVGNIAVTSHTEALALQKRLTGLPLFQTARLTAKIHNCDVRESGDISDDELASFVAGIVETQAEHA